MKIRSRKLFVGVLIAVFVSACVCAYWIYKKEAIISDPWFDAFVHVRGPYLQVKPQVLRGLEGPGAGGRVLEKDAVRLRLPSERVFDISLEDTEDAQDRARFSLAGHRVEVSILPAQSYPLLGEGAARGILEEEYGKKAVNGFVDFELCTRIVSATPDAQTGRNYEENKALLRCKSLIIGRPLEIWQMSVPRAKGYLVRGPKGGVVAWVFAQSGEYAGLVVFVGESRIRLDEVWFQRILVSIDCSGAG